MLSGAQTDMEQILDELEVRCDAEGCGKEMQRSQIVAHVRSCPKVTIQCSDGACEEHVSKWHRCRACLIPQMRRQDHVGHRIDQCASRRMKCEDCGVIVAFRDRAVSAIAGSECH